MADRILSTEIRVEINGTVFGIELVPGKDPLVTDPRGAVAPAVARLVIDRWVALTAALACTGGDRGASASPVRGRR